MIWVKLIFHIEWFLLASCVMIAFVPVSIFNYVEIADKITQNHLK